MVPSGNRRIAITEDPELAEALRSVVPYFESGQPTSRIVRDLAIQGARQVLEDEERRQRSIEYLIEWSTNMSEEQRELLREARRSSVGGETEEW